MSPNPQTMRLIVGITGASGLPYAVRLLEVLRGIPACEVHLVMTSAAKLNVSIETDCDLAQIEGLAHVVHSNRDISAAIASGSFRTDGMIVMPCSMRTLSAIVHSFADNLLVRAADVVLKERRRLVLVPREAPLHAGHCKMLYDACLMGAIVFPPVPAFYTRPGSVANIVDNTVSRVLDLFGIDTGLIQRWSGLRQNPGNVEGVEIERD